MKDNRISGCKPSDYGSSNDLRGTGLAVIAGKLREKDVNFSSFF